MKKTFFDSYETPIIEVIELQVEQGFAVSSEDFENEWGQG